MSSIDTEIEEFVQSQFKVSVTDCLKTILISTLYGWIRNMKSVKSLNRKQFEDYLEEIKDKCEIIPKVVDRSSALFRSRNFEFKNFPKVADFIKKIEKEPSQLFYMMTKQSETFYGSCLINQELKAKTCDEYLILSTDFSFDIEDGLKIFAMENCFNFLIFVENVGNLIQNCRMNLIKSILRKKSKKRALIITDQVRSEFAADITESEENFLTIQEIKLSDLTPLSLELFLEQKQFKLQDEDVTLKCVLNSTDTSLIDAMNLKDLENIQTISHNVTEGKNFDADLYIPRKLFYQNVVGGKILSDIGKMKDNEKIVMDEKEFKRVCKELPFVNVHLLKPSTGTKGFSWKKSRGEFNYLLNYGSLMPGTPIEDPWKVSTNMSFTLVDVPGMGKKLFKFS